MKNKNQEENLDNKNITQSDVKANEPKVVEKTQEEFQKIEAVHHWIDDIFSQEKERLSREGICEVKVWVEGMACIDKALSEHPMETLEYLAKVYGVTFPHKENNQISSQITNHIQQLAQNQQLLWNALELQREQTKQLTISNFISAKDNEGNLLHPHFLLVKDEMFALLNSGVAFDFETAYEKALWLNPQTRRLLVTKQSEENLQTLADEAKKAKDAGFSPQGKPGKEDYSQMTTREILERKFKELRD